MVINDSNRAVGDTSSVEQLCSVQLEGLCIDCTNGELSDTHLNLSIQRQQTKSSSAQEC